MCCEEGGSNIQSDQTKWPLTLSLLVLNQMTLQQELLTRVHKSVCLMCMCARVQEHPFRWSLVSVRPLLVSRHMVRGIIKHSFTSSHILETDAGDQVTQD